MNLADGLKQLTRMCDKYICPDCPLCGVDFCWENKQDISVDANEKAAAIIEKWAEKNTEPVYPSWVEWFRQMKMIPPEQKCFHTWLSEPIPASIAQKLGIEPKEDT